MQKSWSTAYWHIIAGTVLAVLGAAPMPAQFGDQTRAGGDWWSLQPLRRVVVPSVDDSQRSINPIDQFILHRLKKEGLAPSPIADRRTLIQVRGKPDWQVASRTPFAVTDPYVPVGASRLRLNSTDGLRVGDGVLVEHPSTKEWIAAVGMMIVSFSVLTRSCALTNWLGNRPSSALSNCARSPAAPHIATSSTPTPTSAARPRQSTCNRTATARKAFSIVFFSSNMQGYGYPSNLPEKEHEPRMNAFAPPAIFISPSRK